VLLVHKWTTSATVSFTASARITHRSGFSARHVPRRLADDDGAGLAGMMLKDMLRSTSKRRPFVHVVLEYR